MNWTPPSTPRLDRPSTDPDQLDHRPITLATNEQSPPINCSGRLGLRWLKLNWHNHQQSLVFPTHSLVPFSIGVGKIRVRTAADLLQRPKRRVPNALGIDTTPPNDRHDVILPDTIKHHYAEFVGCLRVFEDRISVRHNAKKPPLSPLVKDFYPGDWLPILDLLNLNGQSPTATAERVE